MKAITIWQPWASLIAVGAKKYETRSWATPYCGPIAIHAGKKDGAGLMTSAQINALMKVFAGTQYAAPHNRPGGGYDYAYPYGAVIATAELVGCWEIAADVFCKTRILISKNDLEPFGYDEISEKDDEYLFGDWTPGRYAWELANVQMLREPIPAKGKQGLWNWAGGDE